ncbi:MAG TPA: DUF2231 domain-containing protein [Amnibacterium sp.]|jgi:uncharacterized membrane protein|nr:DUF2231 domain-containing protein [Amnibacterium sp.]
MVHSDVAPLPAKQPATALAGPYGHPLHPALVAVPIGAWIASLVFDLASFVVPDPAFLVLGARWLIGIGVLGALAAAVFGFLDLLTIPPATRAQRIALVHMTLNLCATVVFVVDFLLRAGHRSGPVGVGPLVLSVAALAAVGLSGYLGGELAYRYGVRVADERVQASGYRKEQR